jgi:small nuclear ribonucleoprotein (snRNP)-like protein
MFDDSQPSNNADRLTYALANLLGEVVAVHLCDGRVVEGIFASKDDQAGLTIALCQARYRPSAYHSLASEAVPLSRLVIEAADVIMIDVEKINFKSAAAVQGRVDGAPQFGEMQRWADATDDMEDMGLDDGGHKEGSWDQFEANKAFGVKTSYREDIYTTRLDKTKITREQQAAAAELERAINARQSRGLQHDIERGRQVDVDEGTQFSDVARPDAAKASAPLSSGTTGAYVPPSKRKAMGDAPATPGPGPAARGPGQSRSQPSSPPQHADPMTGTNGGTKPGLRVTANEWRPPGAASAESDEDYEEPEPAAPQTLKPLRERPANDFFDRVVGKMEQIRSQMREGKHRQHTLDWTSDDYYPSDGMAPMGGPQHPMGGHALGGMSQGGHPHGHHMHHAHAGGGYVGHGAPPMHHSPPPHQHGHMHSGYSGGGGGGGYGHGGGHSGGGYQGYGGGGSGYSGPSSPAYGGQYGVAPSFNGGGGGGGGGGWGGPGGPRHGGGHSMPPREPAYGGGRDYGNPRVGAPGPHGGGGYGAPPHMGGPPHGGYGRRWAATTRCRRSTSRRCSPGWAAAAVAMADTCPSSPNSRRRRRSKCRRRCLRSPSTASSKPRRIPPRSA